MSAFERYYWIDAAIRDRRHPNASVVAEQFGIQPRTAKLDFQYLRDRLHAPLRYVHGRRGYEYTDTVFALPRLLLTEAEIQALRRALLAARDYGGVAGDAEALRLLAERVGDVLDLSRAGVTIDDGPRLSGDFLVRPELFEDVRRAVGRRQRLRLIYFGAHRGEQSERTIQPWHVFRHASEWYVTGFCEWRQTQRDFHLSRIRDWKVIDGDAAFTRPANFDPDAYVRQAFGVRHGEAPVTVRIRFSPHQSVWIREREYHASQILEDLPDGGVIVTFRVAGTFEIRRWVLQFGADAEVLEPQSLRDEIMDEIARVQKLYDQISG